MIVAVFIFILVSVERKIHDVITAPFLWTPAPENRLLRRSHNSQRLRQLSQKRSEEIGETVKGRTSFAAKKKNSTNEEVWALVACGHGWPLPHLSGGSIARGVGQGGVQRGRPILGDEPTHLRRFCFTPFGGEFSTRNDPRDV